MSKLKKAYDAFAAKLGVELASTMANTFGATNGRPDTVPEARRDGCAAALNRILHGEGHISMAMAKAAAHGDAKPKRRDSAADQDEVFRAIRAEAFGADKDDDVKPAAEINPREIYARWNASKRPSED
ncbi:hypothetical protein IVB30_00210 [Bradyrhizobium sp. 200]|uniref:hypothetical protein n=1 Tax=Bradyrhizobium sp. 200 TaxID=2782665 RepID=UPI00200025F6|nr:hypothetical protein [Bradyrhizobium sp. 200]UPJ49901.1 hypothetical protein IVB30_00210 [Bradyrhizobium sp. 200]